MKFKALIVSFALSLLVTQPAKASYDFSSGAAGMDGTFAITYALPVTVACFIKIANHPASLDYLLTLHKDAELNEFVAIQTSGTNDAYQVMTVDTSTARQAMYTASAGEYDGVWVPIVGTIGGLTERDVFVELIGNTTENTSSTDPGSLLDKISVGEAPNNAADFKGLIAECAMWDVELSDANITSYLGGTCAANIDSGNLIGYWPMDASADPQLNEGTDTSGDLTVTTATFDADHPTITCGGIVPILDSHRRRRVQ